MAPRASLRVAVASRDDDLRYDFSLRLLEMAMAAAGRPVLLQGVSGLTQQQVALGLAQGQLDVSTLPTVGVTQPNLTPLRFPVRRGLLGARLLLAVGEQVAALLMITPWDRLENVASHHYPWLPVRWLLRDRYDSVVHLAGFERPVAVVVAAQDDIVPAEFGAALHDALPGPKRLWTVPGGHNDWAMRIGASDWRQMLDFLLVR